MTALRIGLVGYGKIAQDQHLPAIAATPGMELVAVASRNARWAGGPTYESITQLLSDGPAIDAIALCQPPQARFDAALAAIAAGKHVFLEKPPGATLSEVDLLAEQARAQGVTLFASWHSRFAPGVAPAREWLARHAPRAVEIVWKEDVRHWHPGQTWIWQAGGMGVFDPGINALSIATAILPPFFLREASLAFPSNCAAPIAADLDFVTIDGVPIRAAFDFRQTGPQSWDIRVEADGGTLLLAKGGAELSIDGAPVTLPAEREYAGLYAHFAQLCETGRSDVDISPLRHVADAFLRGDRTTVDAFVD